MATKADFTEDEWKAMQKGVTGAGMLVAVGDRDFTDSSERPARSRSISQRSGRKSESTLAQSSPRSLAGRGSGCSTRRRKSSRRRSTRCARR